jgi:hypothetical protein
MEATASAVLGIFDRYGLPDTAADELVEALRADEIGIEAPWRRLALIDGNSSYGERGRRARRAAVRRRRAHPRPGASALPLLARGLPRESADLV